MPLGPQNLIALPPGFRLGEYRIERYLGSGGFGITYAAIDENLHQRVAIKEYLPKALAMRDADDRVTVAVSEDETDFRWGLERFLDEARALARFDHPNIVRVKRFIEAHGTGYIVMGYVDGASLSELLKRRTMLTEAEIREHVVPVLHGLAEVHAAGLLHRDIKPGNIVIRAPLEQYSSSLGDQRPTTDIYALGAVLYRCVTGDTPPDATDRALKDRLTPAAEAADGTYSPGLLNAIDAALRMSPDERPRDIAAFLQLMSFGDIRRERPEDTSAIIDGVLMPFPVEFARSSGTRGGATTLIPVESGGAQVKEDFSVLASTVDLDHAKTLLWRRGNRIESARKRYKRPTNPRRDHVLVETIDDFTDLATVLFTRIGKKIKRLPAERLAKLAICSASGGRHEGQGRYLLPVVGHRSRHKHAAVCGI